MTSEVCRRGMTYYFT